MKPVILLLTIFITSTSFAQNKPYYYQIPDTPATYTAATVAARLVDGLGFRYFWATEGLTEKDMNFRPSKEARTTFETLQHIDGLTRILLNSVSKQTTKFPEADKKISFAELRERTLQQIKTSSELLKQPGVKLEDMDMIFEGPGNKQEFPFWNLVNGPVSDALWHVGQVVSFRRSSGNPMPEGVSVLTGTKTEP
jgi:hypothetical protein